MDLFMDGSERSPPLIQPTVVSAHSWRTLMYDGRLLGSRTKGTLNAEAIDQGPGFPHTSVFSICRWRGSVPCHTLPENADCEEEGNRQEIRGLLGSSDSNSDMRMSRP